MLKTCHLGGVPRFAVRNHRLPGFTVSPFACLKAQIETCTKFQGGAWLMHKDDTQALSRSKEARRRVRLAKSKKT